MCKNKNKIFSFFKIKNQQLGKSNKIQSQQKEGTKNMTADINEMGNRGKQQNQTLIMWASQQNWSTFSYAGQGKKDSSY